MMRDVMRYVERRLAGVRLAYRAVLSTLGKGAAMQLAQAEGLAGETVQAAELCQQFGFTSGPPKGTQLIILPLGGSTAHSVVIATENGAYRVDVASGEACVYSQWGDKVHLKKELIEVETKTLRIKASEQVIFETPNISMNGFTKDLRDKILGVNAHVVVSAFTGGIRDYQKVADICRAVPGVTGVTPFVYSEVMLSASGGVKGVVLRGIDPHSSDKVLSLAKDMAGLSTAISLERDGRDLKLSDVRLRLIGADVTGEITFVDVTELFHLQAKLNIGRFSPRSVINAYWPGTIAADHQGALAVAEGPLNIMADVNQLVFETPGLALDNSRVRGRVRMGFDTGVSGLDFTLAQDKLNADALIAAFTSGSTSTPLTVGDLPLRYLREAKGEGRISAETLTLAGVTGKGAEILWRADKGLHKALLKPLKAQGGVISGDFAASFAGGLPGARPTAEPQSPAVIGWTGSLKMDDVDSRQVGWVNKGGVAASGPMDLRLRAEAKPAAAPASTRLVLIAKRASGDVSANITPAQLDIIPDGAAPRTPPRRMLFSSLSAQGHFAPAPAGDADWALHLDGGFSAVGTKPLLNLDVKVAGLAREKQGRLTLTGGNLSGRLRGWFLPKRENEADFSAKGSLDFGAQTAALSSATLSTCGLNLSASLTGSKVLGAGFAFSGHVRCPEGDPRRVLAALDVRPPKSADKRALTRFSCDADMTFTGRSLSLANMIGQLDDMPLRGSYAVQNFDAPRQTLSLSGGNFDLDRYLPAPEAPKRGAKPEKPTPEHLPVEALRELNMDGNVALRNFKYKGLTTRDFKTTISAHAGSLLLKPMGGSFYGGTLSGEFSAQVAPGGMQTRLALVAKDFQAGGFMLGWAGKEVITGKADLFLDLTGFGATDQDVLRTLDGLGSFKITDGSYVTTSSSSASGQGPAGNFGGSSSTDGQSSTQVSGHRTPSVSGPGQQQQAPRPSGSRFSLASAKVKVKQGVFMSDDFRMNGQNMVVTGKGRFSPADDTINVRLNASMPGMPDVPMRVFGRLKDPEMEISTGTLIGNTIKEILGIPLRPIKFFKDLLF